MKLPLRRSVPLVVLACAFAATAVAVPSGLTVAMRSADQRTVDATHTTISAHLDSFEEAFAGASLDDVAQTIAELMGDREVLRAVVIDEGGTIIRGDRLEDVGRQIADLDGFADLGPLIGANTRAARRTSRPQVAAHSRQQRVVGAAAIGPPGPRAPILVIVMDTGPERFKVRHDSVATLGVFLTFVFLSAVVAGLAFHYLVARRASALLSAAERVAAGNLETRTGVGGEDEIGVIGAAFDAMVARLAERREETNQSEQKATALRQALVVQERLAALGTLAASVGHEINNPLTYLLANLRSAVDIIRDQQLPEASRAELEELLDDAIDGADRVRRIVADLNVFARPTQAVSSSVPVDLRDVVERAVNLARPALANRCRVDLADMPSLPVLADESRLAQVALNLLTNACQAMPADRSRDDNIVTIRARRDGAVVLLEVTDNGVGMTEDVRQRIFEPFFTTRVGHGSGLGLAISRELVVSLGGEISVASAPGRGATFTVQLRAAAGPPLTTTVTADKNVEPGRPTRSTVLVIDDDVLVARVIARQLAPVYDAVIALTVREGLDRLHQGGIACTICDLSMPDGGARTLLQAIEPVHGSRIIVVTGGAQTVEAGEFLDGSGLPVITKPIDRARLLACVAGMVDADPGFRR